MTDQTNVIKEALSEVFDRVLDLYDGINMPEHKNELLCFAGIDSYNLGEAVSDGAGASSRHTEVVYLIKALGKRGMNAAELAEVFDSEAVPALEGCGLEIKSLKRGSCVYSKEQSGYIIPAELTVSTDTFEAGTPNQIEFSIGGDAIGGMTSFEITSAVKTAETPVLGGTILNNIVGRSPLRVTLRGTATASGASTIYAALSAKLGTVQNSVTVGGITFTMMALTGLELETGTLGMSTVKAEFTEVNAA